MLIPRALVVVVKKRPGSVSRSPEPITLSPQLRDLLIFFVDHAGSLVTKDELLNALWPNANVTENAVAHAEKVARRGYRFIAIAENVRAAAQPTTTGRDEERHEPDAPTFAVLDFANVTEDTDASLASLPALHRTFRSMGYCPVCRSGGA